MPDSTAMNTAPHAPETPQAATAAGQEAVTLTLAEVARGSGFAPEAFEFLQRGLAYTTDLLRGEADEPRHVSGAELCCGLRDYAIGRWGAMAGFVLGRWGVTKTGDFGAMVYHLVAHDVLSTSDDDRVEDFQDVFDFDAAFDHYHIDV